MDGWFQPRRGENHFNMIKEMQLIRKQTKNPIKKFFMWRFERKFKRYWMDVVDEAIWYKVDFKMPDWNLAFSRLDVMPPNWVNNQITLRDFLWSDNRDIDDVLMLLDIKTIWRVKMILFPVPDFETIMQARMEKGLERVHPDPDDKMSFIQALVQQYQKKVDKVDTSIEESEDGYEHTFPSGL